MSRICKITGKKPMAGNNVSKAHNKTRRVQRPNHGSASASTSPRRGGR